MSKSRIELGGTGISVSRIGLGVTQFSKPGGLFQRLFPAAAARENIEILTTAAAGGINWFDTTALSGARKSEQVLAESLQDAGISDAQARISSTFSPFLQRPGKISRTVQQQLNRLAPYSLDLLQIQNRPSLIAFEKLITAAAEVVVEKEISGIGGIYFDTEQMLKADQLLREHGLRLASNQIPFNLLDRTGEENGVLDAARELGVTIIAATPLASGILSGAFHHQPELLDNIPAVRRQKAVEMVKSSRPLIEVLEEIGRDHHTGPAQVALSWVISYRGDVIAALPGASRVRHVEQCLGALELDLSAEEISRLEEVSKTIQPAE